MSVGEKQESGERLTYAGGDMPFTLVLLCFLLPLGEAADLVIRIPGNGQPKDGYYRLDYRYMMHRSKVTLCHYFLLSCATLSSLSCHF